MKRRNRFLNVIFVLLLIAFILGLLYYLKVEGKLPISQISPEANVEGNTITLAETKKINNVIVVAIEDDIETTVKKEEIVSPITNNDKQVVTKKIYRYFYDQLDETSKSIYNKLEENVDNMKSGTYTITFGEQFNTLLNEPEGEETLKKAYQNAWDAFYSDRVDIFYLDSSKMYLYMSSLRTLFKTTYTVSIGPEEGKNYFAEGFTSEKQVKNALKTIEEITKNVVVQLSENKYQRVKEINDCLVVSLSYDESIARTHTRNLYGALVERQVVCEGYAKAFKYMMDEIGIPCILVSGKATNSTGETEAHLWNYVQLDGNWYGVDVTWNDPVIIGNGKVTTQMMHQFLCKGQNFMESHIPEGKVSENGKIFTYPTLNIEDYIK